MSKNEGWRKAKFLLQDSNRLSALVFWMFAVGVASISEIAFETNENRRKICKHNNKKKWRKEKVISSVFFSRSRCFVFLLDVGESSSSQLSPFSCSQQLSSFYDPLFMFIIFVLSSFYPKLPNTLRLVFFFFFAIEFALWILCFLPWLLSILSTLKSKLSFSEFYYDFLISCSLSLS